MRDTSLCRLQRVIEKLHLVIEGNIHLKNPHSLGSKPLLNDHPRRHIGRRVALVGLETPWVALLPRQVGASWDDIPPDLHCI